ncbi:MAG: adenylosuccinate lyase [Culicoidibacterales bacterium]
MENYTYQNPLSSRYASQQMQYIFSPDFKFKTWRKLWVWLAESEQKLGLDFITDSQIMAMKQYQNILNLDVAKEYEKVLKHDVMAHVHAYGDQVPEAKGIIHLGATSAYVGDNTDLIQIQKGLNLVQGRLLHVIDLLSQFAKKTSDLPTLGFTHFQSAQLTTVGKRATLWIQSLMIDLEELNFRIERLPFRGVKGTTGTQASFKELFAGDFDKVKQLDQMIALKAGFQHNLQVTGQTYDRKIDDQILSTLKGIAISAHKMTNDLRLLQHLKEIEEPFSSQQIGSSAMAYKRNPMKSERIASLAKFVINHAGNGALVASTQWFERTLDDSANKRLSIPQSFLAIDAILLLLSEVMGNLVVYPKVIEKHILAELPFMITENIMMKAVQKGQDRQEVHEIIRELSQREAYFIKNDGKDNQLIQHIIEDGRIQITNQEIDDLMDASKLIGFSSEQVEDYIQKNVQPILDLHYDKIANEDKYESI